ncbi:hypothetical protein FJ656_03450 [Schumannella luteola]|uniref:Uncharacterized protein n=1 Tax=Schumannella luteola TaxID=472059 RepID=A0A852YGF1_9MICO|nr:hypothetical protein [Schumannella luteola]NYH00385.1 hypothetical protein [Schumannella luteola]TPX05933.1 hypothetical protein FJ656_03450 [Schumannella luteola]
MADKTVSSRVAATVTRRGFVPALVTAVAIFGAVLVQGFLSGVIASAYTVGTLGGDWSRFADSAWTAQLAVSLTGSLPFAAGVFLCLWQIAPVDAQLRLGHVLSRAVLATVVGAVAVVVIVVLVSFIAALAGVPDLFGGRENLTSLFDRFGQNTARGVLGAAQNMINQLAVVMLGAVLLWGWLQRHPRRHEVRGALDEV